MKNLIKQNLLLGFVILTLGACGNRNNGMYSSYYAGGSGGINCSAMNTNINQQQSSQLGAFTGDFGNGATLQVYLYQGNSSTISASGSLTIPDINQFLAPGIATNMGQAQAFVSCLTSNGFSGTISSSGTGAYRNINMVLQGTNVTITLGSNPGTYDSTFIAGNQIEGPVLVQMNGVSTLKVLTP